MNVCSRELRSVRIVMAIKIEREQRYIIHYCYSCGLTPAETYRDEECVWQRVLPIVNVRMGSQRIQGQSTVGGTPSVLQLTR